MPAPPEPGRAGWMQRLRQGLRNKQTADRLGISEVTVKVHRHRVMEKMQAASLPALLEMLGRLEEAAQDLYASPSQTFWRVTFPLVLPGIVGAALLAPVVPCSSAAKRPAKRAAERDPSAALLTKGRAALASGDHAGAAQALTDAYQRRSNPEALLLLGQVALAEAAQQLGVDYHLGITASVDTFYEGQERSESANPHLLRWLRGTRNTAVRGRSCIGGATTGAQPPR